MSLTSSAPLLVISVIFLSSTDAQLKCGNIGCLGDLVCPSGQLFTPNVTLGNCCPGCVTYLNLNDACTPTNEIKCRPGLECSNEKCTPSNAQATYCQSLGYRGYMWSPRCDLDGSFAAVQCKGSRLTGRCFCYSKNGNRLFGQQWWSEAENMTCACSRRVEELRAAGKATTTLHCTADGNFDTLQCDSGVCWCAMPRTGDALSEVVPEYLWRQLPCYNATVHGSQQYLRRCDSVNASLSEIREDMERHGTVNDAFVNTNCDLNGGYGALQYRGIVGYCAWFDNSQIGSYAAAENVPRGTRVDCNCARDSRYFSDRGYAFTLQCESYGNYRTLQRLDDQVTCVDSDGYAYQAARLDPDSGDHICDPIPSPI